MVTFKPKPDEYSDPWIEERNAYDESLENAIRQIDASLNTIDPPRLESAAARAEAASDEAEAARLAAQSAAALVGAPAGDAVRAVIAGDLANSSSALSQGISSPTQSISLLSPQDRMADTKRLRITSSQKQEASNNYDGGETIWLDLESPLAKSMLTWRLRFNPVTRSVYPPGQAPNDAPYRRVVWAGAHWFAQNQPDDDNPTVIHGHWSVEVPDVAGALQTRFQIFFNDRDDPSKVGTNRALISTNRADFMVEAAIIDGKQAGRFIMAGGQADERFVEFTRGTDKLSERRWVFGVNNQVEGPGDVGGNFVLKRFANDGTLLGSVLYARRSNGEVTIGSEAWTPPSDPSQVLIAHSGGAQNGILVFPSAPLTTGAAFKVRLSSAAEKAFQVRIGTGVERYSVAADGKLAWGDGSGAVDTYLYRDVSGRLKTDGDFAAIGNLRTGAATGAGGSSNIAVGNGVPPTSTSTSQFNLYSEAGVPKFATAKGTVKLDVQSAIPNATDSSDAVAKLNDLLLKLRTIGLIST